MMAYAARHGTLHPLLMLAKAHYLFFPIRPYTLPAALEAQVDFTKPPNQ